MRLTHTHADHAHSTTHLDRRRRHRPALVLPPPRRLRASPRRSTSTSSSASTARSPMTTSSSTRRSSGSSTIDEIEHAIVREVFAGTRIGPASRWSSLADIPSGTGLGSSGSFTVGLLRAVYALQARARHRGRAGRGGGHIEIDVLGEPVGKQDQYIAAFGGLTCFEFHPDDRVDGEPLASSQRHAARPRGAPAAVLHRLPRAPRLDPRRPARALGGRRRGDARQPRRDQGARACEIREALEAGDPSEFGELMHEHWEASGRRSRACRTPRSTAGTSGLDNGAVGGKLVGAGAGGFLLFYAEDRRRCAGRWPTGPPRDRASIRPRRLGRDRP